MPTGLLPILSSPARVGIAEALARETTLIFYLNAPSFPSTLLVKKRFASAQKTYV